ncbi:hypothetical protein DSW25_11515 [Sulfitobacter donghicola DSW-25 = KCTC 12864 = JCM 14565]|uniref:Uncharacterized protein n=1 Tax=Sulfitobacter donghicola DSW-25 = KCTC 12864 = JCM 14565 TaxID=1300350 RepID=A0A073IJB2_9RHOB|nr:hypothetical protein DSW25_11515 [Sulfitobacter donghicola DSW-25 = KCTC 12864 = JCM 14565]
MPRRNLHSQREGQIWAVAASKNSSFAPHGFTTWIRIIAPELLERFTFGADVAGRIAPFPTHLLIGIGERT